MISVEEIEKGKFKPDDYLTQAVLRVGAAIVERLDALIKAINEGPQE